MHRPSPPDTPLVGLNCEPDLRYSVVHERKPVCARATSGAIDASEVAASGTQFQHDVWAARRTIRAGTTISHSALPWRLGRPKAVRAVGMANGADPIGIVVPVTA